MLEHSDWIVEIRWANSRLCTNILSAIRFPFYATCGDFSNIDGCAWRFESQRRAAVETRKGTGGLESGQRFPEGGPELYMLDHPFGSSRRQRASDPDFSRHGHGCDGVDPNTPR